MNRSNRKKNSYPPWSPRFWNGMRAQDYFPQLWQHRFRIHPIKYPMTALVGICSVFNTTLSAAQRLLLDRRIRETRLVAPPIFIVGHWRSGTTLLHELISLDTQFSNPGNFDAFVPHHARLSRFFLQPLVDLLLPRKRPMDDMELAAGSPQEDDFALISLGAPTPYLDIAFPNDRMRSPRTYDFDRLPAAEQTQIRAALEYFYRTLTLRYRQRLVLKSPPHTSRIAHLAEWFPGAKFVHIARNPDRLVPSTQRLWRALDDTQGFQLPRYSDEQLIDYIHRCQRELYAGYFRQRSALRADQLAEIQFEDLLADPLAELTKVYGQLGLEGLDRLLPAVENYFDARRHHRPASVPDQELHASIGEHWSDYSREFGYAPPGGNESPAAPPASRMAGGKVD